MKFMIINKQTGNSQKITLKKHNLSDVKKVVNKIIVSKSSHDYELVVQAEGEDDDNIIYNNFHNIPTAAGSIKKIRWTGDLAKFIIMNLPASEL